MKLSLRSVMVLSDGLLLARLYHFVRPIPTAMLRRLNETSLDRQRLYFSGWKENLINRPLALKFPGEVGSRFIPIRHV